jgi:hypothetical protein
MAALQNVASWPVADIGPSANLNHLLSASVSRVRCCRAIVSEPAPIGAEHEPSAIYIVTEREPEPAAVGEPNADGCRAATARESHRL